MLQTGRRKFYRIRSNCMKATKIIREKCDLSQHQLAVYLGITRSQLALAETGRRTLPTSALIKLAQLETSLQNNIHYKQQHLQTQAGKDLAAMRRHAKACTHKAGIAKIKLKELDEKVFRNCFVE